MSDLDATGAQERRQEALRRIQDCARSGDVLGLLQALHDSRVLDGLVRRLAARWRSIPNPIDIDNLVGEAVFALCSAVERGTTILEVVAYLWKVANNIAHDEAVRRRRESPVEAADLEDRTENVPAGGGLQRAIAIARSLVPRLGEQNIQSVMTRVLDAVEAGEPLSSVEIAHALGLSADTVRQLKKRAFERLTRIARAEGYAGQDFDAGGAPADEGGEGE